MTQFKPIRKCRKRFKQQPLRLEALEDRCVPTAALLLGSVWAVQGTEAADRIVIDRDPDNSALLRAFVNDQPASPVARVAQSAVYGIRIEGSAGNDVIRILDVGTPLATPVSVQGGAGDDLVVGGDSPVWLDGGDGSDTLQGGASADTLSGGRGNDLLSGQGGNDELYGGLGDDTLDGSLGQNALNSGGGQDILLNGRDVTRPTRFASGDELLQSGSLINRSVAAFAGMNWPFGQRFQNLQGQPGVNSQPLETSREYESAGACSYNSTSPPALATNPKVPGVDEPDRVRTDGRHIYVLDTQPEHLCFIADQLTIVRADPAANPASVSWTPLEGRAVALYLSGNRLTVVSRVALPESQRRYPRTLPSPPAYAASLYGLTKVAVFDVSDPAAPRAAQETYLDGEYVDSRAIGGRVFVVLGDGVSAPRPVYRCTETECVYETAEEYRTRLAAGGVEQFLPGVYTPSALQGGPLQRLGLLSRPEDIYRPRSPDQRVLSSVVAFDVTREAPGHVASATAVANGSMVYTTAEHLYLANVSLRDSFGGGSESIQKFQLGANRIDLVASGEVYGAPLVLDEAGPNLRVLTTVLFSTPSVSSNVYVLADQGGVLNTVGALEGVAPAPGNSYSGWFEGNRGFVALHGPDARLLSLDLSDPVAPRVAAEVQLTGSPSTFYPLAGGRVLALGSDVDDQDRPAWFQASILDASDVRAPRLIAQERRIGPAERGWGWASIPSDIRYKGIRYYPERQMLVVVGTPLSGGESNVWVLHADATGNIHRLGEAHVTDGLGGLPVGDTLYAIAQSGIAVFSLNDLGKMVASVGLRRPDLLPPTLPPGDSQVFRDEDLSPPSAGDETDGSGGTDNVTAVNQRAGPGESPGGSEPTEIDEAERGAAGDTHPAPSTEERFVARLYHDFLGRRAEPAGLAFWTGLLKQGALRTQVAGAIAGSPEARTRLIQGLYRTLLGREADALGLSFFLQRLAAGGTTDQVRALLLASPEYYRTRGQGTDHGFLQALYRDALGRETDAFGEQAWRQQLARGVGRADVATLVLGSPEARQGFVRQAYRQLLHREAESAGLAFFSARLAGGLSQEEALALIAGSAEYGG